MSEQQQPSQPSEEELRAAYEQQLKQIKVDDAIYASAASGCQAFWPRPAQVWKTCH